MTLTLRVDPNNCVPIAESMLVSVLVRVLVRVLAAASAEERH